MPWPCEDCRRSAVPAARIDDRAELIVDQHDRGGFARDVGPALALRHADMLQRRGRLSDPAHLGTGPGRENARKPAVARDELARIDQGPGFAHGQRFPG